MDENKKYYWIKLKTDFFNQETIDFLLSQKNGCEYIVLYQMLCLNTANNNGELSTKIGEMIIPYDVDKIARDTKYFDNDTIVVALGLFKKLGLIYEEDNKTLKIASFDEMVGSESKWAEKKRLYREKQKKELKESEDIVLKLSSKSEDIVRQEYRDKRLEYRDKIIDIDNKDINNKKNIYIVENVNAHDDSSIPYSEIIDHLNNLTGASFKHSTKKTKDLIKARFKEGFTLDNFKMVIEKKVIDWKNDDKMKKYLRPETLFGNKFEGYLNEPLKKITTKDLDIDISDF